MDTSPVRILHLSDFHFRKETSWDADPLLERLIAQIRDGSPPDIIVVTGDVAHSGKSEEYLIAESWFRNKLLPAAHVEPSDLFFVPGNHDVDRKSVSVMVKALQKQLLERSDDTAVQAVYADPQQAALLFARFSAYQKFVASLRGEPEREPGLARPWWVKSVVKNDINIRLAGVCSAWMSCEDSEQSKLLLGTPQILELNGNQGDVNIALMHHPEMYLNEGDSYAIAELHNWAHLILRGHLHQEAAAEHRDHVNQVVTLAAGCAYQGSAYPSGFQILEIFGNARKCHVHPFRWSPDKRRWHHSKDVFEGADDGVGRFSFGASRRQS